MYSSATPQDALQNFYREFEPRKDPYFETNTNFMWIGVSSSLEIYAPEMVETKVSGEDAFERFVGNMTDLEQYAESVIDYTSKYNSIMNISYSPENLTGRPVNYPAYGDFPDAYMLRSYGKWWNESEGAQKHYMAQDKGDIESEDYITLRFECPVIPTAVIIYETYNPGAIVKIWVRYTGGLWRILWEGVLQEYAQTSRKFSPPIRKIRDLVNELRIDLNQSALRYHTSLDAVLLAGKRPRSELQIGLLRNDLLMFRVPKEDKGGISQCNSADGDAKVNFFTTLPYEIMVHIFQYLDLKSLCRCAQVNKLWHTATLDAGIYHELSLKKYWHKTDDELLRLLMRKCRGLRKLDLSWCGNDRKITEEVFIEFLQKCCKHLKHLSLGHCNFVGNASIEEISRYQDLVDLRLRDCHPDSWKFSNLGNLNRLVALDLYSSTVIDDSLIKILKANPHLKHLNVDFCEHLTHLDQITEIVSYYNGNLVTWSSWKTHTMSSVGVGYLARCPHLRELDLGWCLILTDPEDCLERIAQGCKDLRRLIISGWRGVSDHLLLPIIRSCKQLTQLDLLGIKNISGDICDRAMASLPKLQLLDISFCDTIKAEQVAMWRETYPHVAIHRSCEFSVGDYWN